MCACGCLVSCLFACFFGLFVCSFVCCLFVEWRSRLESERAAVDPRANSRYRHIDVVLHTQDRCFRTRCRSEASCLAHTLLVAMLWQWPMPRGASGWHLKRRVFGRVRACIRCGKLSCSGSKLNDSLLSCLPLRQHDTLWNAGATWSKVARSHRLLTQAGNPGKRLARKDEQDECHLHNWGGGRVGNLLVWGMMCPICNGSTGQTHA